MNTQIIEVNRRESGWTVVIRGAEVRRFKDRESAIIYARRAKSVADRSQHGLDLVIADAA